MVPLLQNCNSRLGHKRRDSLKTLCGSVWLRLLRLRACVPGFNDLVLSDLLESNRVEGNHGGFNLLQAMGFSTLPMMVLLASATMWLLCSKESANVESENSFKLVNRKVAQVAALGEDETPSDSELRRFDRFHLTHCICGQGWSHHCCFVRSQPCGEPR